MALDGSKGSVLRHAYPEYDKQLTKKEEMLRRRELITRYKHCERGNEECEQCVPEGGNI